MQTINKILVVFIFACLGNTYGQSGEFVVQGIVQDSITSETIEGASVILKQDTRFLAFGYTDAKGVFKLSIPEFQENLVLVANSMGFAKQEISLLKNQQSYSVKLAPQVESLDEVLLQPDEKIVIKTDTLRYKVSAFTNKTEQTVEDVLRNIPGVEIDGDGNIKAQGQYIKKILIEGDDLADNNYKIISKNLDAQVLDEVEVISNYEENPVLKKFLNSDAKVLNLKLKEDRKTVLFGTNTAGIGNRERSKLESNLGLIKEKIKFLNLGKWNNTGEWADEQLSNYVSENSSGFNDFDKDFSIKLDPQVYLQESTIMLDERNYIQNKSFSIIF
ncbi:CarboxypepD_reg-like domain-containing protein [Zunongwangia mangrovi]|uniref:CarboxypepD_reg-like domain-containing protein n=1 Tax=Zunongwangia mangrovi TaxID=1334022 RepID=A0A1I1EY82_9FLAO|nr:carboxypeptidase-like regulatory domain-containing protein [Zunongwangia mangrovi]SFB91612.1 CarboxypepD_reg-like domain-containing protein [Zunongwangia mangrovi]